MDQILTGAMAMGYAIAGLFFLRFWRDARDRLFGLFALAFFVLAVNRISSAILGADETYQGNHVYWIRLAAFLLILVAIIDKNRSRR
jgi:uncharacterized membrane protein